MSKITRFTKSSVEEVRLKLLQALDAFKTETGLEIDISGIRYSGDQMTGRITVGVVAPGESLAQKEWNQYCWQWRFKLEDFGREFKTLSGDIYTICGCKPSSPKYPILGKGPDGRIFKFRSDTVKTGLLPRKPKPAPSTAPAPETPAEPAADPAEAAASSPNPAFGLF